MYAGLWRHARSLTVGAVCVALSVAGHLVGGGSAPDLAHAPVAALGLAVMTALRCLARRAGDHPGRSDALPRALATRHPCILPASDRRHERFSVLLLHRATRRPLRRTRPSALLGRPRPSGPPRGRAPSRALHLPAGRAAGVLLVAALTLAGAFTSAVTSAAPASAHAVLVKASPADGAVLSTAPRSVVLQFDDPISTSFATLTVTGPDGRTVSQEKALVSGTTVSGALADGLAPGRYRTVFRVVSEDGHPVNGQLTFTLKLPGGPAPSATAPAATSPAAGAPGRSAGAGTSSTGASSPGGGPSWLADHLLPVSGALLLVVIGAGALLRDRLRH